MRTLLTADWVLGHRDGRHCLLRGGQIVVEGARILFVGHDFPGEVDRREEYGPALIAPGFIDLDALADLDTTILGFDNHPAWRKGRVWPRSYVERGPYEMYTPDELAFQKRYAFGQLLRHGITTALPISSLFYREWGETPEEFAAAADSAGELGLRVYLGPAYRTGNLVVEADERIVPVFDEARGLRGLEAAIAFCRAQEGRHGGLVRTMLAPDRIETCTATLLRRTADASRELGVPVRLHCCQSKLELDLVLWQHGMRPAAWLGALGVLSGRWLLPHGTWASEQDLALFRDAGSTLVHCPVVSARGGRALDSFARCRRMGLRVGMGTDTAPPDMLLNLQVGAMLCRVMEGDPACIRAEDFFDAATVAGADALGRPDLGRLAAGAMADLVVWDGGVRRPGPTIDPIQSLLLDGSSRDVCHVMVDGAWRVREGALNGADAAGERWRAQRQYEGLIARYPERSWKHPSVETLFSTSYPVVDR